MGLADTVEAKLRQIARNIGNGSVSVGFMADATYPDGTPVASVAYWNEFGHHGTAGAAWLRAHPGAELPEEEDIGKSPPRPFFRQMIAKDSPEWTGHLKEALIATDGDGPKALALMGEEIEGELVQSINDFTTPPLAASTIRRKRFAKPLIDTSQMVKSPTYKVNS